MKTAAIIIGCWEQHTHNPTIVQCYERILNTIYGDSDIETVWLGGNNLSVLPENWYQNSKQIFVDECGVDWVRRAFTQRSYSKYATASDLIVRQQFNGKPRLLVWDGWQIEHLLNHTFAHIEKLQYFGIGWDTGVKRDPVGWGHACDLIKHKHIQPREIVASEDCVLSNITKPNYFRSAEFDKPNFAQHNWQLVDSVYTKQDLDWF